jgi:hypothetical protein
MAFVRRHATGATGRIKSCDVPFVKFLDSKAPSRRLDRGACASSGALSLRGTRIVQVTVGSGRPLVSQVRLLSIHGGRVRVLADQGFGEESNVFSSPNQSAREVWVTRTGARTRGRFVQIDIATGRRIEIPARIDLGGMLVRDDRGAGRRHLSRLAALRRGGVRRRERRGEGRRLMPRLRRER